MTAPLNVGGGLARELGRLSLADALGLCVLFARKDPVRFGPAAARWHARFVLETRGVALAESQLVLSTLAALNDESASFAAAVLADLAERRRLPKIAISLRHALLCAN